MSSWFFEKVSPTGGATAGAFRNTLAGVGIDLNHLVAREAIQNSVDAAIQTKVKVRIDSRTIEGESLRQFRKALSLTGSDNDPTLRKGLLVEGDEKSFVDRLSSTVDLVTIEDFNTVGLGGTWKNLPLKKEDNYFRLCMELGGTKEMEQGQGRGGTYGYGKSVYWISSSIWSVVMYSRFQPTERSEKADSRLIVVSWFRDHEFNGVRYTGRAWFGDATSDRVRPIEGGDAHSLAGDLGFRVRGPGETGLSLMIVGASLRLADIRAGVERWWWPRILEGNLEVEIAGQPSPDPRSNLSLSRFIKGWDLIKDPSLLSDDHRLAELKYKGTSLGQLGISGIQTDADTERREKAEVALIRSPRMVVEYTEAAPIQVGQPNSDGVFLADKALDRILANSEPPAHDRWDSRSTRGDRPLSEDERKLIEEIYKRVRKEVRTFLAEKREAPPEPPDRCRELEQLIGRYLKTTSGGPRVDSIPSVFSIQFAEQPHRVHHGNDIVIDARAVISLSKNAEPQEYLCKVSSWLNTLVEGGRVGDTFPLAFMQLTDSSGDAQLGVVDGRVTVALCDLSDTKTWTVDLRTVPLTNPEYRAELVLQVTEEE